MGRKCKEMVDGPENKNAACLQYDFCRQVFYG